MCSQTLSDVDPGTCECHRVGAGGPFVDPKIDAPLPRGTTFDDAWEIELLVGSGATAHVYVARHMYGFHAALKVMHPSLATSEARVRRFLRQGYVSNRVAHRAAVRVFGDGETETGTFLVMEYVHGETLEAKLARQGQVPTEDVLAIARDLLAFLEAVHGAGLAHRRLNPTEVLLDRAKRLRVIDFDSANGVESFLQSPLSRAPLDSRSPTDSPPDDVATIHASAVGDLFATGAILYRLLTGSAPFKASASVPGPLDFSADRTGASLLSARSDLPVDLAFAVERALSPDPARRFSSARAMLDAMGV